MKARFAFAVYLAGDNNLAEEMVWSLQEMREVSGVSAVRESIDLRVLFDPPGGQPRRYDFPLSTADFSRAYTEDTEEPAKLLERLVARMATGRRFLVLSGHGSGAVGDFLNDEKPAGSLSIPRLRRILEGAGVEILGLDSCQMSTVEVGYEVRSSVSCLVASEGPVLNTGWPYRQILASVAETRAKPPSDVARAAAESYLRFYRDYEIAGVSTDIAVCDLSKIEALAAAVGGLARAMAAPLSEISPAGIEEGIELGEVKSAGASDEARSVRDAIVLAHWSAQSYKCDRYSDLRDFVRQLLRFSEGRSGKRFGGIRKAGRRVLDAVDAAVVISGTTGAELQYSHGLSIYFPWSFRDYFEKYRNLQFARATDWVGFLEVYLRATRRMRRFQPQHLRRRNRVAKPLRMPDPDADLSITKDVEAGTRKDVEAGTRKGKTCRSTMKNPPDGYYPPRRK